MTTLTLEVFGGTNCCLCNEAAKVLADMQPDLAKLGVALSHRNIDGDPQLEARHRTEIPVGFVAGEKVFKYRVDPPTLLRILERRTSQAPTESGC